MVVTEEGCKMEVSIEGMYTYNKDLKSVAAHILHEHWLKPYESSTQDIVFLSTLKLC